MGSWEKCYMEDQRGGERALRECRQTANLRHLFIGK